MASALIVLIALCGGYTFGGLAIHGATIAKNGLLYVLGFFLVGMVEEFSFRGFMQSVLQRALGFWPAAVALSLVFGAIHLPNSGESWKGVLLIVPFGLLASLALRRTGSVWFFIGAHAAFDYCTAFIYSSPMTGLKAQGHLLNASFHGPSWLTGGSVRPHWERIRLRRGDLGILGDTHSVPEALWNSGSRNQAELCVRLRFVLDEPLTLLSRAPSHFQKL